MVTRDAWNTRLSTAVNEALKHATFELIDEGKQADEAAFWAAEMALTPIIGMMCAMLECKAPKDSESVKALMFKLMETIHTHCIEEHADEEIHD